MAGSEGAAGFARVSTPLPWLDPVEAYRRLRHLSPVLLGGSGAHPDARRSYLALGTAWEARLHGTRLVVDADGRSETHDGDALAHVRMLAAAMHHDVEEEGFTGGLVGYFGYEFLTAVEPTLRVHAAATPDAVLRLCRDAIAFDREAQSVTLWCADLPGETGAQARADEIQLAWRGTPAVPAAVITHAAASAGAFPPLDARQAASGEPAAPVRTTPAQATPAQTTSAASPLEESTSAASGSRESTWAASAPGESTSGTSPSGESASAERTRPTPAAATSVEAMPAPQGTWRTSLDQASFEAAVVDLKHKIAEGDLFQANIATRFSAPCQQDPLDMFAALAQANPSPFMALIEAGDHTVVSCSPEQLFRVEDGIITSRPIAGTRPRGPGPVDEELEAELRRDEKENAEHTMLIDLLRNDVAKVSVPGTVHVPERCSVERYRHVMHLVSRVEGRVRPGTGFADWLAALFPGGTITGAPKHRACMRIHEAEPVARGPYTGSAGYLSWSHNAHWNILIRTLVLKDGQAHVHAGSGIVADSDPRREWEEAGHKARALLETATGGSAPTTDRLGEVTRHGSWTPPHGRHVGGRVLIIDNYDSFTHNLADACAALGARVEVVRHDGDWRAAWSALDPTHVILSPGPGRPEDSGASLDVPGRGGLDRDVPVLGVCLGHQALGLATGARIETVAPVHGKAASIHHDGAGLLAGLPRPFTATRYHSLVVDRGSLPGCWEPTAWLEDGTLMAMAHRERPWHGVQFHPESLCTDLGLEILARFLEIPHGRRRVR